MRSVLSTHEQRLTDLVFRCRCRSWCIRRTTYNDESKSSKHYQLRYKLSSQMTVKRQHNNAKIAFMTDFAHLVIIVGLSFTRGRSNRGSCPNPANTLSWGSRKSDIRSSRNEEYLVNIASLLQSSFCSRWAFWELQNKTNDYNSLPIRLWELTTLIRHLAESCNSALSIVFDDFRNTSYGHVCHTTSKLCNDGSEKKQYGFIKKNIACGLY